MTNRSVWCDVAEYWLNDHSLDDLDALQRHRFLSHARECDRHHRTQAATADPAEWPHLSDRTLREWSSSELADQERAAVRPAIEAHLQECEECAERLELISIPELLDESEKELVVAAGPRTPLAWDEKCRSGEATWDTEQPGFGNSTWTVKVSAGDHKLNAELDVKPRGRARTWLTFSVSLTSQKGFLARLTFTPERLSVSHQVATKPDETWRMAPILTAARPAWVDFVAGAADPHVLIPVSKQGPRAMSAQLPYFAEWSVAALEKRLSRMFCDIQGKPVHFRGDYGDAKIANGLAGTLHNFLNESLGTWTAFLEDRVLTLKMYPDREGLIRLAGAEANNELIGSLEFAQLDVASAPGQAEKQVSVPSVREKLKSFWLALKDFPQLPLEPVPVLGNVGVGKPVHIEISLSHAFGVGPEVLERDLPWCGSSIEIARTLTDTENMPVYSAYATEPLKQPRDQASSNALLIALTGPNGEQSTARLSRKNKAAIFEGDQMPEDPESIKVELVLEEE